MCLAIPGRIIEINEDTAVADIGGVRRNISLILVPEVKVGDYVLVHTGFAIEKIDQEEAEKTMALLREMASE